MSKWAALVVAGGHHWGAAGMFCKLPGKAMFPAGFTLFEVVKRRADSNELQM